MGQYHLVVNLDKKQYLHPHDFGDGLKLLEFGDSRTGTMCGLAILLAQDNNRGSGDLHSEHPVIGSWAGDRIAIAGDYGDPDEDGNTLYNVAQQEYENISQTVQEAMRDDEWLAKDMRLPFGSR